MSWKKHFKPVTAVVPHQSGTGSQYASVTKYNTWLPEVYMGPPDRLQRYVQYELMDMDHEVSAALDTMTEFSTQLDNATRLPFKIHFNDDPTPAEVQVLEKYLLNWCKINSFSRRIFRIFRSTLVYGDQFMIRDPETFKLYWVDPNFIEKIIVNESEGKEIETYYIRNLDLNLQQYVATNQMNRRDSGFSTSSSMFPQSFTGSQRQSSGMTSSAYTSAGGSTGETASMPVDATHVVHISLSEGMDGSWPFGMSALEKVYKIHKQKEMLEDAMLIYRIHRAPERRVFTIDTGILSPAKAQQYLERVKFEVQQKRIPNRTGGGLSIADSAYNPLSSLEDYFFATSPEGRGSSVTTLPGGDNLGEINDMLYFNNKMMRALGVPSSYLPTGPQDGTAAVQDGRVGTALIQESRFSEKCKRIQRQIIINLNQEFKLFLKARGVTVDGGMFDLEFLEPQNFAKYRDLELFAAQANILSSLSQHTFISRRKLLSKYLGWSEDEIIENERMLLEEKGKPDVGSNVIGGGSDVGMRNVGISAADMSPDEFDTDDFGTDDFDVDDTDIGSADTDMGGNDIPSDAEIDSFGT